jgi:hypothetical protein
VTSALLRQKEQRPEPAAVPQNGIENTVSRASFLTIIVGALREFANDWPA